MFVRVDVHRTEENEFKKDILWRNVKMKFIRQRNRKHKGNQTKPDSSLSPCLGLTGWKEIHRKFDSKIQSSHKPKTYYEESWKWDVYAKVKETMGINKHISSTSGAQAFQKDLCSCVSMCIKTKEEWIQKDIPWRIVKMRVIRQSNRKHKGNQKKTRFFKKHFKGTHARACRSALNKKEIIHKIHTMTICENVI